MESATGISGYSETEVFERNWKRLRGRFDSLTVVGEVPIDYLAEVRQICDEDKNNPSKTKDKTFQIYRSLNAASEDEVAQLIGEVTKARPGLISLYHMYGFEWGSWVMARNHPENETEVLLNYTNADCSSLPGLHLTGAAAKSFEKSTDSQLRRVGLPGVSYSPVSLVSQEQARFIVEEKVAYQKKITELAEQGVPIESPAEICAAMTRLVNGTHKYLNVTHLCIDEGAIERLRDDAFKEWIDASYAAAKRGVDIDRIFIVEKQHYHHKVLRDVISEMRAGDIKVSVCLLDGLREDFREDFSIYDGKHLVHMDRARSYWSRNDQPSARRTENTAKIEGYQYIFKALKRRV
jgi:hypothetical protein